jgi:ABC-2 type transport system permease protein
VSRPSTIATAVLAQAAMELRLTARRGENVLAIVVVPAAVLVFFASTRVLAVPAEQPVDFLLPGALALGVIAAGLVNLGISTAYERHYGVLKRLGASPLPRGGLLAAKLGAVALVVLTQAAVLIAIVVVALGWEPPAGASPPLAVAGLALGLVVFAGLGLLLAGTLRAEATLAVANGLFLVALLLGGIVVPLDDLPEAVAAGARLLPAAALTDVLRAAFDPDAASGIETALLVLAGWGSAAWLAAGRWFRWE